MRITRHTSLELTALTISLLAAPTLLAHQPKSPPKAPPIDLKELARQPRPGQPAPQQPETTPAERQDPALAPMPAPGPPETPAKGNEADQAPAPAIQAPDAPAAHTTSPQDALAKLSEGVTREAARVAIIRVDGTPSEAEIRRVWTGAATFFDRWRTAQAGEPFTAVTDVRTGLGSAVVATVDESTSVTFGSLTRARVGRLSTGDSSPTGSRVVIELLRGQVQITPPTGKSVNVITPDGLVVIREPATVSHDAAKGTTTSLPAASAPGQPSTDR